MNQHLEQDRDNLALEICQNDNIINSLHQCVQYVEDNEDHAHNEGYSDQYHLNDNNKQRSGSNDREVELHMHYTLRDSLTHTKRKPISHFSTGWTHSLRPMIANI